MVRRAIGRGLTHRILENVADPLMQKIRYLDKLIAELAKGKKMASILRRPR